MGRIFYGHCTAVSRKKQGSLHSGRRLHRRQQKYRILSVGYNGFPFGCSDDDFPWDREGETLCTKYPYVVHAELNAILNNRGVSLEGSKIYTALFPCNECAKAIIQSGIREVVYLSDKYAETDIVRASKKMLEKAGVMLRQLQTDLDEIKISFK